jgi:phi LC3 family holin
MNIKSRLKNKAFILSCVGFVVLLIKTFTNYELPNNFDIIVNTGLSILTALGIVIDPTTEGITDKTNEQ